MGVDCVVAAVSRMFRPSAERARKNDRNDAQFLSRMLAVGNVVEVWVPDEECEAARNLSRAYQDAVEDLTRAKQRLSKFLLRGGWRFDEKTPSGNDVKAFGSRWWRWFGSIRYAQADDAETAAYYAGCVRRCAEEKEELAKKVEKMASRKRWSGYVAAFARMKGVDVVTAAACAVEAGTFSRFGSARSFSAWLGLVPSQHSSGEKVVQGGITRAGNGHVRSLLVQSSWHYTRTTPYPKTRKAIDAEPSPSVRRHADKGTERLTLRRRALLDKGLNKCKANVATAREMAGWIWALGRMVEEEALAGELREA
jgi:transposase